MDSIHGLDDDADGGDECDDGDGFILSHRVRSSERVIHMVD